MRVFSIRRRFAVMVTAVVGCLAMLLGAGTAVAGAYVTSVPRIARAGGSWGTAEEIPGAAALNQGAGAEVTQVSCASAGNCSAGGSYVDGLSNEQAFVVGETNGSWGSAIEVPGTAALNTRGHATVTSVSCASAGNCSAGGYYNDSSGAQAFVAVETNSRWKSAMEVPGTAALNTGGSAEVTSVSCASTGNCSAGGQYQTGTCCNSYQVFVIAEINGTWGSAREIPGTAALNKTGVAQVTSLSCASTGNCSAGGYYQDGSSRRQAFVVGETNGTWGLARKVHGDAVFNAGGYAQVTSVSCVATGNCSAGGYYQDSSGGRQAFVVGETNGTWGRAREVPGTAALNAGGYAQVNSVSCGSAGNCSAGGSYASSFDYGRAFVVDEVNGTWGRAKQVPGTAALNAGRNAWVESVSCASAGNCSAGGSYASSFDYGHAFVVGETNGTWGRAEEVPGSAALDVGGGGVLESMSCASVAHCSAGGVYADSSNFTQVFVDGET